MVSVKPILVSVISVFFSGIGIGTVLVKVYKAVSVSVEKNTDPPSLVICYFIRVCFN